MKDKNPVPESERRSPINYDFRCYVGLVCALADFEASQIIKGLKRGSLELSACLDTDRYRELKNAARSSIFFYEPHSQSFEGFSFEICVKNYWNKLRTWVSDETIQTIDKALERNRFEVLEWKKNRASKKTELKKLINNVAKKMPETPEIEE